MGMDIFSEPKLGRVRRNLIKGVVLATSITVAGCSSIPDAANPVKWFDNTVDYFAGDDTEGQEARNAEKKLGTLQADRGTPPPGEGQPEPNLGNFPKGLSSDNGGRKYASAPIARQGEVGSKSAEKPVTPMVKKMRSPSQPPPPPAVPTAAVQQAQINASPPPPPAIAAPRLTPPAPMPSGPVRDAFDKGMTNMVPPKPEMTMKVSDTFSDFSTEPLGTVIISSAGVEVSGSPVVSAARGQTGSLSGRLAPRLGGSTSAAKDVALVGRVKVATIIFNNGSARLTGRDVRILRDVLKLKRQKNGQRVVVVGHASSRTKNMDPVRHKMVNFEISVSRADIVAKELARLGLNSDELSIDAVSDTEPAYFEIMPSGEAGNRRAEVFIDFPA
jgi:outer membrane protein OmpA-like peptidoglycan-associated protein